MTSNRFLSFVSLALFGWGLTAVAQDEAAPPAPIAKIEIRGTINPASAQYLQRSLEEATAQGARALLVELDTPGGLVSSTREMAQSIDRSQIPVIVYVTPAGASATSAGALLAISAHVAAMAPGSNIGAAHPVGSGGEEIEGASGEKAVNDVAAFARGLAELRGRPVDVASAVVSKSESFSAEEALKKKLIDVVAPQPQQIWDWLEGRELKVGESTLKMSGLSESPVVNLEMHPGEKLLHFLAHPNVAAILMSLGLLLIYAEISSPGLGLPGVAGALCLLVAFMAFQAVPIREGALALVALGGALIVAEFFATTGGVLAVGGIVSFILGLLWLVDPAETDLAISPVIIASSGLLLALGGAVIVLAAGRMRGLSERALKEIGGQGPLGLEGYEGRVSSVNGEGLTGSLKIRGEIWTFESDSPLKEGDHVRVIGKSDYRLKVTKGEN